MASRRALCSSVNELYKFSSGPLIICTTWIMALRRLSTPARRLTGVSGTSLAQDALKTSCALTKADFKLSKAAICSPAGEIVRSMLPIGRSVTPGAKPTQVSVKAALLVELGASAFDAPELPTRRRAVGSAA